MYVLTLQECTAVSSESTREPDGCFLQSRFWAEFKSLHGWQYRRYEVQSTGEASFLLTVLLRPIAPFGLLAYIPMGPNCLTGKNPRLHEAAKQRGLFLAELAERLIPLLPAEVFLLRFDPPWEAAVKNDKNAGSREDAFPLIPFTDTKAVFPVMKAISDVQPPDTVRLDLRQSEETLLHDCKPKWRYNIRLAEKKGVQVRRFSGTEAAEHGIPVFYALYRETAVRDGIAIHTEDYYRSLCTLAARTQDSGGGITVSVYAAFFEDKPLAAIITLFSASEAVYLYGASSNEHRNLMPAYLLQWTAIIDAKAAGCLSYDFYGIPPADDPAHPMYGLYRFKTGFGGMIVHRVGTLDVPVCLFKYRCYAAAERLRMFWFKTLKKKFRSRCVRQHNA
ncbi:MAG: peptidoglycan bridge formation glycyltransferase FemA/FemB family protein [Treponema sp.]